MILFISNIGAALPIVYRMREEGVETKIYINKQRYKKCYDGVVDKVELKDLKEEIVSSERVIFDSDVDISDLHKYLDGKTICRPIKIEETDIKKAIRAKSKNDIRGIKIVAEMWFDGIEPVLYSYCLPAQHLLTGDLGRQASSQTNCLWISHKEGIFRDKLNALIPLLTRNSYVGPISLEFVIGSDKKPYYQGFHVGFKYDSIFCLLGLMEGSVSGFLVKGDLSTNTGFSCSERVTIAPYPYNFESSLEEIAKGVKIKTSLGNGFWAQDITGSKHKIECAGNDGVLGVMTATGPRVQDGFGEIYKSIRKLEVGAPLQFRIDGIQITNKKLKKLSNWNFNLGEMLWGFLVEKKKG